jgi:hypothetical protein
MIKKYEIRKEEFFPASDGITSMPYLMKSHSQVITWQNMVIGPPVDGSMSVLKDVRDGLIWPIKCFLFTTEHKEHLKTEKLYMAHHVNQKSYRRT